MVGNFWEPLGEREFHRHLALLETAHDLVGVAARDFDPELTRIHIWGPKATEEEVISATTQLGGDPIRLPAEPPAFPAGADPRTTFTDDTGDAFPVTGTGLRSATLRIVGGPGETLETVQASF